MDAWIEEAFWWTRLGLCPVCSLTAVGALYDGPTTAPPTAAICRLGHVWEVPR